MSPCHMGKLVVQGAGRSSPARTPHFLIPAFEVFLDCHRELQRTKASIHDKIKQRLVSLLFRSSICLRY